MSKPKLILQVRANPLKKIEPGDTEVTYDPVKLETTPFIQVSFFSYLVFEAINILDIGQGFFWVRTSKPRLNYFIYRFEFSQLSLFILIILKFISHVTP